MLFSPSWTQEVYNELVIIFCDWVTCLPKFTKRNRKDLAVRMGDNIRTWSFAGLSMCLPLRDRQQNGKICFVVDLSRIMHGTSTLLPHLRDKVSSVLSNVCPTTHSSKHKSRAPNIVGIGAVTIIAVQASTLLIQSQVQQVKIQNCSHWCKPWQFLTEVLCLGKQANLENAARLSWIRFLRSTNFSFHFQHFFWQFHIFWNSFCSTLISRNWGRQGHTGARGGHDFGPREPWVHSIWTRFCRQPSRPQTSLPEGLLHWSWVASGESSQRYFHQGICQGRLFYFSNTLLSKPQSPKSAICGWTLDLFQWYFELRLPHLLSSKRLTFLPNRIDGKLGEVRMAQAPRKNCTSMTRQSCGVGVSRSALPPSWRVSQRTLQFKMFVPSLLFGTEIFVAKTAGFLSLKMTIWTLVRISGPVVHVFAARRWLFDKHHRRRYWQHVLFAVCPFC